MRDDEMIRLARDGFEAARAKAGTADIVARVRRMPNGTLDVTYNRREDAEKRLRLSAIGGEAHAHFADLAKQISRPAPKGSFYLVASAKSDDSDADVHTILKTKPE
jgi:hypothetical protein